MTDQMTNTESRKPYRKPKIERIRLTLEDSVLGTGCKNVSTAGPDQADCFAGYQCNEDGS